MKPLTTYFYDCFYPFWWRFSVQIIDALRSKYGYKFLFGSGSLKKIRIRKDPDPPHWFSDIERKTEEDDEDSSDEEKRSRHSRYSMIYIIYI